MKTINISVLDEVEQLISIECERPYKIYHNSYSSKVIISPKKIEKNRNLVIDSNGIIDVSIENNKKNLLVVYNTCHPYSIAHDTYDILKYEIASGISVKDNKIYLDSCDITFCNLDDMPMLLSHYEYDKIFGNQDVLSSMVLDKCKFYEPRLLERYKLVSYVIGLEDN